MRKVMNFFEMREKMNQNKRSVYALLNTKCTENKTQTDK